MVSSTAPPIRIEHVNERRVLLEVLYPDIRSPHSCYLYSTLILYFYWLLTTPGSPRITGYPADSTLMRSNMTSVSQMLEGVGIIKVDRSQNWKTQK